MYTVTKSEVSRTLAQYRIRTITDNIPEEVRDFIQNAALDALKPHKQDFTIDGEAVLVDMQRYFGKSKKVELPLFLAFLKEYGYVIKKLLKNPEDGTEGKCID